MNEIRTHSGVVEVRQKGEGTVAFGYAARFDTLSQNLGGFVERIAPGTFSKTVQEADVRALFNHDPNQLLGRAKAGTLRLWEDDQGLAYEVDLPNTTLGRDLAVWLERGDITGSSFGFRTIDDEWGETDQGFPMRTLRQVALRDVGPVVFPAYTEAEVTIRSLAERRHLDPEVLVAAAQRNELRQYLFEDADKNEQDDPGDGRENLTVIRNRRLALLR